MSHRSESSDATSPKRMPSESPRRKRSHNLDVALTPPAETQLDSDESSDTEHRSRGKRQRQRQRQRRSLVGVPEFRLSRMLPTVLVGAIGAAALYFIFRVFEGGLEFRSFFFIGLVVIVTGGVGPVQLGLIFTMHSVERRVARRRFSQRICVWCTYALEGGASEQSSDEISESVPDRKANRGDRNKNNEDSSQLRSQTSAAPEDERCPECGNEVRRSLAMFERVSNRRLIVAAIVSVVSVTAGCAAAEAWLVADNAAFRSEVAEFVATGNTDSDFKRPRRWPNGWSWLVYDHETETVRASIGR